MFLPPPRKRRLTGERRDPWAREPLPKRSNYPAIGFDDGALIESINERQ